MFEVWYHQETTGYDALFTILNNAVEAARVAKALSLEFGVRAWVVE